jgi:hypothetical protein
MPKRRTSTIITGTVAAALMVFAPSAAWAAIHPSAPPPAVLSALQPGSATFDQALTLDATDSTGTVDQAARVSASTASFGTPHAYYYYWPSTSDSSTLTDTDVYLDRGRTWLAAEHVAGAPHTMLEVSDSGAFVALGGWSADLMAAIDALPANDLVVTDGRFDETYAVSADLTTITALDAGARSLIGGASTDPRTFRTLKAAQYAADAAAWKAAGAGPDSSGGMPGATNPQRASDVAVLLAEVAGGAAMLVGAGYLLGRGRRRKHAEKVAVAETSIAGA